jgi:hypothetical protein
MSTVTLRARRRLAIPIVITLLVIGTGTVVAAGKTPPWKAPPFAAIGVQTIALDASHRSVDSPSELVAFVETGSQNSRCLATLNELAGPLPRALFCAPRNPTIDGVNPVEGIWLHVIFDEAPGEDLFLSVNVYQEDARFFGPPVRCGAAEGC